MPLTPRDQLRLIADAVVNRGRGFGLSDTEIMEVLGEVRDELHGQVWLARHYAETTEV